MCKFLGLAVAIASAAFASPVSMAGVGNFFGADATIDLTGAGFNWHISTDSSTFMGDNCDFGSPCDLGLFFSAGGDSTTVQGTWNGQHFDTAHDRAMAVAETVENFTFQAGVAQGMEFTVPMSLSGTIHATGGFRLNFSGTGTQTIQVFDVEPSFVSILFGQFNVSGQIDEPAPEPGTLGLAAAGGLVALVAWRMRRRRRAV